MSRTKEVTGLKNASECLKVVCLKKKKKTISKDSTSEMVNVVFQSMILVQHFSALALSALHNMHSLTHVLFSLTLLTFHLTITHIDTFI